jgi:hypothetical protein
VCSQRGAQPLRIGLRGGRPSDYNDVHAHESFAVMTKRLTNESLYSIARNSLRGGAPRHGYPKAPFGPKTL